jgi:hypothetical protein
MIRGLPFAALWRPAGAPQMRGARRVCERRASYAALAGRTRAAIERNS